MQNISSAPPSRGRITALILSTVHTHTHTLSLSKRPSILLAALTTYFFSAALEPILPDSTILLLWAMALTMSSVIAAFANT